MDLPKFCEKCNKKKSTIEDEEKDPVSPTQVEAAQRDGDEGEHQRQAQGSCEDPRQQALYFELRSAKKTNNPAAKPSAEHTAADCVAHLYIRLCFTHLHQTSQTHTKQHVCRTGVKVAASRMF